MLTEEELKILEKAIDTSEYSFYCFWIPFSWASNLIQEAYKAGKIDDILLCIELQKEINKTKNSCFDIMSYDWVNFPLAYTQVVTIAVYSYFGFALLGRQYLDPSKVTEHIYLAHQIQQIIPKVQTSNPKIKKTKTLINQGPFMIMINQSNKPRKFEFAVL